jgi:hypothetical protein
MVAAVLCPGPSLPDTYPGPESYPLVVAVNRAAIEFRSDVFACLDFPLALSLWPEVPARVWLTCAASAQSLARRHLIRTAVTVEGLDSFCPVPDWRLYTAPAAVVYAASEGATQVDIYGCDLRGVEDFDGVQAGENRTERRWARERGIWAAVTEWLAGRGVEVRRVSSGPASSPHSPPPAPW